MNRLPSRRLPTECDTPAADAPDTHAASRQHVDRHRAVVDLDDLHAFGATAVKRPHSHLPRVALRPFAAEFKGFEWFRFARPDRAHAFAAS